MKKSRINILIVLGVFFFSFNSSSQELERLESIYNSHQLSIPDLGILIDSALSNSGMLNFRKLEIESKNANLKYQKRYWTRNFGIQGGTRYGTIDNFSSVSGQNSSIDLSTNVEQLDYYVGAYVKFPIFDAVNRRSEIKKAETEIEQAKNLVKFQRDEVVEWVIKYYEDLLLKQNLLELRASNMGNAKVNMEMAEKEFKTGLIPVYEYVRISDITSRISSEYEEAKSEFMVAKRLLENLTGLKIN